MIKTCARCGHEFDGNHNAKYCSDECRLEVRNEGRRRRYQANIEVARAKSLQRYHARFDQRPPRIKTCEVCGTEFEAKTNAKYCPACRKVKNLEAVKRWRATHSDKVKEARRHWQQQNREHCNELQRKWREVNQPETPARRQRDPEREREYKRRYYAAHREEILADQHQRYEQKRLKLERQRTLAKFLEWRKRHENHRTDR